MKENEEQKSRIAVHELVYREIRQSLMIGTFIPGQKISLRTLAEQVGTSLTPVRGAVNRLIAEGAFEIMPNRWFAVPLMSRQKFDEITHWRLQLESAAVKMACEVINEKGIQKLEAINNEMIQTAEEGHDRKQLLSYNYTFHFELYRQSKSAVLLPMIESLWLQCGPFTYYSLASPKDLWNTQYHLELIQALVDRDQVRATEAITKDIENTASFLREYGNFEQPKLKKVLLD